MNVGYLGNHGRKGNQKISGNVINQLHVVHLPRLQGLCMLILPDFNQTWISCQILVKPASIKLMKIRPTKVGIFSWERTIVQAWQLVAVFAALQPCLERDWCNSPFFLWRKNCGTKCRPVLGCESSVQLPGNTPSLPCRSDCWGHMQEKNLPISSGFSAGIFWQKGTHIVCIINPSDVMGRKAEHGKCVAYIAWNQRSIVILFFNFHSLFISNLTELCEEVARLYLKLNRIMWGSCKTFHRI